MIIEVGEKIHVMYRSLYEKSTRRHLVGEVLYAKNALCRISGFVFIYDEKKTEFIKKTERRITIINAAESGYIVNIINPKADLESVHYSYSPDQGLIATDDKCFTLNINEFGSKS